MAKALYGTLFDWIVLQVNHVLAVKQSNVKEVLRLIVAELRLKGPANKILQIFKILLYM